MAARPGRSSIGSTETHYPMAATWPLFLGLGLVMVGNGLQGVLIGVRSASEGFGSGVGGVVMAAYFGGFLAGSRLAARWISTVGHIRVFAALASLASAAALVHALIVSAPTWIVMRFVTGLCMAGLYVVVESWLNDSATNASRGRVLAVYMVVSMGGLAAGNALLGVADPAGFRLFALSSVLISVALVPIALSATTTPPPIPAFSPMPVRDLLGRAPIGVVVAVFVGMSHGVLLGLGPVYAGQLGLDAHDVSLFVGLPILASVLFQWPIGLVSDRLSRRLVIFGAAAGAIGGATLAGALGQPGRGWITLTGVFVLGGCSFSLYSLVLAYTNDFLAAEHRVGASTTLVIVNGIGAVTGPLVFGQTMQRIGLSWFFVALVITHGSIAVYVATRMLLGRKVPQPHEHLPPIPPRASVMVEELLGSSGETV